MLLLAIEGAILSVHVLERRLYEIRDAAELLRIPQSTLRYWLEGDGDRPPVLREEPRGDLSVSWGEFVEAGMLRSYRDERVSLQHLRRVIELLREEFDTPYPLASQKPFIGPNQRLVLKVQRQAELPDEDGFVYEIATGQTVLRDAIAGFLRTVEFDANEHAARIRPLGRRSPVVLDPEFSFGDATVGGIRTEVLKEQVESGEPIEQVAADFDLPVPAVKAALAWEWQSAA